MRDVKRFVLPSSQPFPSTPHRGTSCKSNDHRLSRPPCSPYPIGDSHHGLIQLRRNLVTCSRPQSCQIPAPTVNQSWPFRQRSRLHDTAHVGAYVLGVVFV
eukprot:3127023-Amphidinium_carterae.1